MSTTTSLHTSLASNLAPQSGILVSQRTVWQSPVTYLFGGLAAMLALIAFALLLLACSYWKLSRDEQQQSDEQDLEKGDGVSKIKGPLVYEEKIVVIMAGNDVPTFLANPTPTKQHLLLIHPTSKLEVCPTTTTTTTTSTTSSDDDNKPKEDENDDQNHS